MEFLRTPFCFKLQPFRYRYWLHSVKKKRNVRKPSRKRYYCCWEPGIFWLPGKVFTEHGRFDWVFSTIPSLFFVLGWFFTPFPFILIIIALLLAKDGWFGHLFCIYCLIDSLFRWERSIRAYGCSFKSLTDDISVAVSRHRWKSPLFCLTPVLFVESSY